MYSEKRQRTDSSRYDDIFRPVAAELDAYKEKRERLVKASRDTTAAAKKVIFKLLRVNKVVEPTAHALDDPLLDEAEEDLAAVRRQIVDHIAAEFVTDPATPLTEEYWRYQPQFSAGLQEYIEAACLYAWVRHSACAGWRELQAQLPQVPIDATDYLLGVCDLTGEVMREAVQSVALGNVQLPFAACRFLQQLLVECRALKQAAERSWPGTVNSELDRKLETMASSVVKVEETCYKLRLRQAEYPAAAGAIPPRSEEEPHRAVDA